MHEIDMVLECKNPEAVAESIRHDMRVELDSKVDIKADKKSVVISIKSKKLSHLKAIVNSYISVVAALNGIEELK
jgi:tRNA threonylcarbamoyladenosine modification (KEOPS) complex  Pcc1 subunit